MSLCSVGRRGPSRRRAPPLSRSSYEASASQSLRLFAHHRTQGLRLARTQAPRFLSSRPTSPGTRSAKAAATTTPSTASRRRSRNYSWRDYGNRIGIWRLFDLADELAIPLAHNMNSALYDYAPQIFERIRARPGDEIIAHGRTNSENIHDFRWEADEARLIREVTETFTRNEGKAPKGWLSGGSYENPWTVGSSEGGGLHLSLRLARGRSAVLDAHALGSDPLGALSGRAQRFTADHSPPAYRRASSAT